MAKKQTRKPKPATPKRGAKSSKKKTAASNKASANAQAKNSKRAGQKSRDQKKPSKSSSRKKDPRQRLQRVMASAGIGSRRECELIIEEGRVEVDGEIVMTLGVKVDPTKQQIYVDAQELVIQRLQYFMLNKPPGILSTSKDPSGRPRVIDLIKTDKRVYNVGRLDQSSEGLILVTNDGELANRLTHPRYGIEKKYHVHVVGVPAAADLRKLEQGVYIAEGLARATKAKVLKRAKSGSWLEIILAEGRNREIRRMLAGIGHKVRALKRVSIGPLKLGELPLGAHRQLTPMELKSLKNATDGSTTPRKSRKKKAVRGPRKSTKRPVKKKKALPTRKKRVSGQRGAAGIKKPRRGAANPTKRKRR